MVAIVTLTRSPPHARWGADLFRAWLGIGMLFAMTSLTWSQTPVSRPVDARSGPVATVTTAAPLWGELTRSQQQVLHPLVKSWDTLSTIHRRKWITLVPTYATLTPENQEKMQARMVEWAALSPREREAARLNFAEAKKVTPTARAAGWEAYQALSVEERQKLASQAARNPTGAAITTKPIAPNKLATVPVTRHTPVEVRKDAISRQGVDEKTLLPQAPRPAAAAPEPAEAESTPALPPAVGAPS